jgi:phosphate starvation-inducible protein PhoH and related proteins
VTQVDLPASRPSGLIEIQHVLHGIEGIRFVYFDHRDVVRHDLVSAIVRAYDRAKPGQPVPPHRSPPHRSPPHPTLSPDGGDEGFPSQGS